MEKEGIDYFNPAIVMALLMALMSDAAFLGVLSLAIPIVGLVITAIIIGLHYFASFFLFFLVLPRLRHFIPQLILFIAIILPLPTLLLGIVLAIILQNRLIEFVVTAAAIIVAPEVAIPVSTAIGVVGAGVESLEEGEGVGTALEKGAMSAAEAAVASRAAGKVAKATGVAEKKAEVGVRGVVEAAPTGKPSEAEERKSSEIPKVEEEANEKEVSEEALGGELEPEEKLERELLGGGKTGLEVPQPEKKTKPEEEDEELPKAA